MTYNAIVVRNDDNSHSSAFGTLTELDDHPSGVTVRIEYSTLNYKDALAVSGRGPIIRTFPLIPGIDFSGVVVDSADARFAVGDRVVATGFGLGVDHNGGLSQLVRVPAEWLVKLPAALSTFDAMSFGTAGLTAMLSIIGIENHGIVPASGPVIVTGAGGGVGGLSVHLLARLGYTVLAATGRASEAAYLTRLGAAGIVERADLSTPGRPLAKARWAAGIDNVGSHTLANLCAGLLDDGIVMSCGMAQGLDFPGSIAPFVLRGITIAGVNSVNRSMPLRQTIWERLADLTDRQVLASMIDTIGLDDVPHYAGRLLDGEVRGRLVVNCGD
ncbi:MDR family oxidoreductase [Novosphingobium resinovorum]|uniref:MDR family oxidoreductase n=1 Tax=Novosphingobium resinovorum TaxID=158500 RepID=UPI002ED0B496|nr:MDR family oxidoreductase [Novosphingobium resinovorum]